MKVRKQKLLSMLLCTALTVTNIVSEGFPVSANELLPEQQVVAEDSTEIESEMPETQESETETGGNLPSEETDSTENEKDKETETETKEEETETDLKETGTETATWETESGLDEIETETEEEAYPNALIPFEIGGTDIFAGLKSASFYSAKQDVPKYDPRTESPEEMTSVKDQNPWGTCWSFAMMETLESSMIRQGLADNTIDLSERHLAYFARNTGSDVLGNAGDDSITSSPSTTYLDRGGNAIEAAIRLMNWQGAAAESKYEYSNAKTEPLALDPSAAQDIEVMAHDIYFVPTREASKEEKVSAIKKLIVGYGCVSWSYGHINSCYNKETFAYYCPQKGINHAITVVGWDDDFPAEKFSSVIDGQVCRPSENGAWLVKNSWGSDWGEDGYFYISYEDGSLGSVNPASVSVAARKTDYDHNYFYGNTSFVPKTLNGYYKVSQVYQIRNGREQLKAVSVLIKSDQMDYSIQIYRNPILEGGVVKDPESGEPMLQTPETGKTGYTGLYTIDLSEPVIFEKGDYISIVIDFSKPGRGLGSQYAHLYTDESSTDSGELSTGGSYTTVNSNVTHEGQSFYCDWNVAELKWAWYDAQTEDFNFRINALTVDADQSVSVKKPVFDPAAGIIEEGQSVTIKADDGAEIYYTLDGSEPTAEIGMKYSAPLELTEDVTVKAVAVKNGVKSETAQAAYKYYKMKLVLSETEVDLSEGGTHQLEVLQKPTAEEGRGGMVSWESSDPGIVTVSDNGAITGSKEGTAVITAKAEDYKGNEVTASCQVTVTEADNNIASGSYGDITWVIDADGKLTVTGTGDFSGSTGQSRAPWYENREFITSAEINVTGMTDASYMFYGCSSLTYLDVSGFNTGKVINMKGMFAVCSSLTCLDLSSFNTENVINMRSMFSGCSNLISIDVSNFDTANVMDMGVIFSNCSKLVDLDVSGFNTSNVAYMGSMFNNCSSLTRLDLSDFNTENTTYMGYMFYGCNSLTSLDVSGFDTQNVTNMAGMFTNCASLVSLDVSNFDTKNVISMCNMFYGCKNLANIDVSGFDTGNVRDMQGMFLGCKGLASIDVSSFDTGNALMIQYMFSNCSSLENIDVSGFDTRNVNNIAGMFSGCSNLTNIDISGFNTENITNMKYLFRNCYNLTNVDISNFDVGKVKEIQDMFSGCFKLTTIHTPYNLTQSVSLPVVGTQEVWYQPDGTMITELPQGLSYSIMITKNNIPVISTPYITAQKIKTVYECGDVLNIDDLIVEFYNTDGTVKKVTDYSTNKNEIDLSVPGTKVLKITYGNLEITIDIEVVEKQGIASGSYKGITWVIDSDGKLTVTGTGNFSSGLNSNRAPWYRYRESITSAGINVKGMTDASYMFFECKNLVDINMDGFYTDNITDMSYMFYGCKGLSSLDVSGFATGNVTDMDAMFWGCEGLSSLDVSGFATDNVTNMSVMFYDCKGLSSLDVSGFATDNVTDMSHMFSGCEGLSSLDVSGFATDNVTDMSGMFYDCKGLSSLDVSGFATGNVTRMDLMFTGCKGLSSLDVSGFATGNVTRMDYMFHSCKGLTSLNVSGFVTDNVTNMSCMFWSCEGLSSLDVSGFTTDNARVMSYMFYGCERLSSLDVSGFATGNVTRMNSMFYNCSSLTSLDLSSFDISKVEEIGGMFDGCSKLTTIHTPRNLRQFVWLPGIGETWYQPDGTAITELPQNLSYSIIINKKPLVPDDNIASGSYKDITWVIDADGKLTVTGTGDFSSDSSYNRAPWYENRESITSAEINVTGMTNASWMFYGCKNLVDINMDGFNTDYVTSMSSMFSDCEGLTSLDVSGFVTDKVTDMFNMFGDCRGLTSLDVSGFVTENVTRMDAMFKGCGGLTSLDVSGFVTGNVTNMEFMFYGCKGLTSLDVSGFTTGNVTSMDAMFSGCEGLTSLDVSGFATDNVTDMASMFLDCEKLTNLDVSGFTTGNVISMACMFYGCEGLTSLDVSGFTTGNVTSMSAMFSGCGGLTSLDVSGFATGNVTSMCAMLSGCKGLTNLDVSGFATDNVTDMSRMFSDCEGLTSLDVSDFVTDSVTNMSGMFHGCKGLTSLDVSGFVTDNITNMSGMFEGCKRLTSLDVSSFVTDNVMDMSYMFYGCERLTGLDVSGFATRNVTSMYFMFNGCKRLTSLDVSGFTTGNVTSMGSMFSGCEGLTSLDMSGFTTDNVTDMGWMFYGCEELTSLDMSSFVTDNVTDMSCMFRGCKGLTSLDVSGFATENATDMGWMFYGCEGLMSLDVSGFDTVNVASMEHMFSDCSSLVSIDISNFDVGKVKYIRGIFNGCSNLTTIYTPCNLKQSVSLPTVGPKEVWYQPDGTAITELPQNLNYSIIITKKQQSVTGSLSAQKIKTAYNCGEELELNDLTVTYTAENGTDTEVTDYTTNAAEIDMSTPGIKTLAITYEGITVELELIVTYLLDEGTVEIILPAETYIYDGTAKQPEPIVTAGKTNTKLTSGKDYTLSYENNIDAGTAFMIITGQNDYQGTLKSSFRINKAAAPETVEVNIYTPCDKAQEGQTFDIAGRYGDYGRITGYEIKDIVEDNEIGGTVFVEMPYIEDGILYYGTNTGKGGDSAAVTVEVSFANYESSLLNVVVEFTDERAVYTVRFELAGHGQAIAPVTVLETGSLIEEPMQPEAEGFRFMGWYKDQSCTEAWDFDTDTVQDNIILYAGWLVEAAELEGADLYIQEIQNQIYTGSALKPSIRVYAADGDTRLKEGKDYTIKYFNNKNADQPVLALAGGTSQTGEEGDNGFTKNLAYVIIKGKGNYKGTIYRNFHIDAASIAGNDGEPAKGFTLKYKEQLLQNASKAQKPFQSIRYKKSMKVGTDYELKLSALEAYDSEGNRLERGNVIADADSFVPLIPAGYKGTFLLTITGIGNYKGSIDKTVCVTDKNHLLKNATVSIGKNCKSVRYTGEDITLRPAYYDASQKKYYAMDNDGLVSTQAEPDGNNVFVVKAGGKCLKYGEDYTVSYTNNQAVGTATMRISGKGEYLGSKDVTFRITGMAFNAKNISVDGLEASMEYTGKPLTQNGVRLKSMGSSTENSIELTYGKDYTVNYRNNLKKGTATMTFMANPSSGYTGRFKKTFKITAASLTDTVKVTAAFPLEDCIADGEKLSLEGTVAYEKSGAKPSGRIRLYNKDGILLKEGIDYSVSYAYNKVVTTADTTNLPVMNLKGKGNYTGSLSVNFRITEASMEDNENLAVTAAEVAFYKNKADNYTYQPKITVMDGKDTLNPRTDYTVKYERCTQAEIKTYLDALQGGRATEEELEHLKPYAVIEAKEGNGYVGSIRKELTVYRTKLTGNNLYIVINTDTSQITYTGEQVKPEVTVYYGDSKAVKKAKNKKETRENVLTDKTGDYCLTKLSLKISENGIGDYTLSYGTNVTAGKNKGNVTVIGTGLYGGRVKVKFTINSKDVYTASK